MSFKDKERRAAYIRSRYKKLGKKCPHSYDNCVPECQDDNLKKHDRTPLEFLWEMEE